MLKVLKPFTTVNRRFSPGTTPEITPDDLAGCAMSLDTLLAKKFIAAHGAAAVPADEEAPAKSKKSAAA